MKKASIALCAVLGLAAQPLLAQAQSTGMTPGQGQGGMSAQPYGQQQQPGALSSGGANLSHGEAGMGNRNDNYMPYAGLPTPVSQGDVTYVCGGVGNQEQQYMKQQAKDYDMMLTFATRQGKYLADVDVDVKDSRGNSVLQANCDGPMMLIDLPRGGKYRVRAEAAGYSLNRTVNVRANGSQQRVARAVMTFPQAVAEGPSSASTSIGGSGNRGTGMSGGRNERWENSNGSGQR